MGNEVGMGKEGARASIYSQAHVRHKCRDGHRISEASCVLPCIIRNLNQELKWNANPRNKDNANLKLSETSTARGDRGEPTAAKRP